MAATLVELADPSVALPDFLVLDATIVVEWFAPPQCRTPTVDFAAVSAFGRRVRAAALGGTTLVILPQLALEECFHVQAKWVLKSPAKSAANDWVIYRKENPATVLQAIPNIRTALQDIIDFPMWVPEADELVRSVFSPWFFRERVPELMASFHL